ncbi:putative coenzyme F390 synthetase FtsA [Desulforapulum autotrophicum HRM2]|uniref:Coenzyme F390 synthetase FtsA n=1 Tax=Desulforapulum autotrophicum (strain ATCC 43914 / DSM 3382 / VKM B-1955 / HRM2) TaxID=177437 RepID=C0QCM7_DESAH|nr:phenylacetate--CoA ligase family protein [Desulforapulum autotrophicum]ACN15104.1 putative coenzyme F390 synthetase FtsA [Desulforapulum autotrophicum HRM2]
MIPIIARNIFRLQELLLGRPSFKILSELNKTQWWSQDQLETLRVERLKNLIAIAYEHTPYWKQLMDSSQIHPGDIRSLGDLKHFPLLEKDTLRERREDMVWRGEGKRLQLVRTSGSTNEALEFYTSSSREAHINAARMRGHEWVGIRRGEKEMYYWGSPVELSKQDKLKHFRDWLVNDGLSNGFEVTRDRVRQYVEHWLAWKPKCIFGYPSTFVLTVAMCKEMGLDLKKLKDAGLHVIVTTSEMLSDVDREIISQGFGVKVYDSFGLREGGLIGHECEHQTMHCMDEQVILETINPETLEPTKGEGELVVTNIVGAAFPIIRYRTGDIVTLSNEKCACGRSLSSIKISGGRAVEFIVTNQGKWVVGYSFIYIARSVKGIVKFQVIQEKMGEICVHLAVDNNFPENGMDQVKVQVQKRLNSDDKIIVEIVDDIKPAPSGKYRPVISKVAEELFRNRSFS